MGLIPIGNGITSPARSIREKKRTCCEIVEDDRSIADVPWGELVSLVVRQLASRVSELG